MGSYIYIKKEEDTLKRLEELFNKHYEMNKDQFRNDFGELHTFDDMFTETENSYELKTGVLDKDFYPEFVKEIKDNFEIIDRN